MEFSGHSPVRLVVPESVWLTLKHCESPRTSIHFPDSIKDVNKFTVRGEAQVYRRSSYTPLHDCKVNQPTSLLLNPETSHRQAPCHSSFNGARKRICCEDDEIQILDVFDDEENLKLSQFLKSEYLAQVEQTLSKSYSRNLAALETGMEALQFTIAAHSKKTLLSDNQKGKLGAPSIERPWGKYSYSDLIAMALRTSPTGCMTLAQIYDWIVNNVPYFKDKGCYLSVTGWKNAIRHTLSLRKRFTRVPDPSRPYKTMWTLSPPKPRRN